MNNNINNKKNYNNTLSSEELSLLDVISASYLSIEDIKWLKSKRWFKRFIKIYARELKKRYKNKPIQKRKFNDIKKDEIEILDFTQKINMPSKEIIEILDFTKTIDITDIKDITKASEFAKKKVKLEKDILNMIIGICVFLISILLIILINWLLENKNTTNIVEDIYEVADVKEISVTTTASSILSEQTTMKAQLTDYENYANMNIIDVNFDNLLAINKDTKGWINVNGTKINYPFVQTSDNEYYLKHSFDKSSNKKGWVYLDYRNDINNLSSNNILYAHGLVNNTMFGSMRKIFKANWYKNKNNHIIRISTPNSYQTWQVFSIYTIIPESYYITTKFPSDTEYEKFLQTLKSRSIYDFGNEVNKTDKILTLSSCYNDEKRMVLHAKLLNIQQK